MKLFTYGLLKDSGRMRELIGRRGDHDGEVMNGYKRIEVNGLYAIVPDPGTELHGVIYRDLKPDELKLLDNFEGQRYERITTRTKNYHPVEVYMMKDIPKSDIQEAQSDSDSETLTATNLRSAVESLQESGYSNVSIQHGGGGVTPTFYTDDGE